MCCCNVCCCDCILVLIALVFPPFPVWVKCGVCSAESFINIALCFLGYLPGVLHSFYIIAKYPIRYVVLDEEAQIYRVVNDPSNVRRHNVYPRATMVTSSAGSQLTTTDSTQLYYGSTSSVNNTGNNNSQGEAFPQPPPYTELDNSTAQEQPQPGAHPQLQSSQFSGKN